jgi:hypothetical protein
MGREDGRNINPSLLGKGQSNASQPLVEMGDDSLFLFVAYKLVLAC